jgi:hypothetical protein
MPGLLHGAGEEARIEQVQDRVLDAADILIDRQPVLAAGGSVGASRPCGAVKRAKYQDESTKVSIVSVSRRAGLAALRAGDVLPGRVAVERIAGLVEGHVLGQLHRQVLVRHRHVPQFVAMDHRDRAAPVALARNAPVAQAEVHLALALRGGRRGRASKRLATSSSWRPRCHAVEEARIDQIVPSPYRPRRRPRTSPDRRPAAARRDDGQVVFAGEIEVALVMRRAAEDGAGAVVHQHEVGDVDRQRPARVDRMLRADAGVEAELLGLLDASCAVPMRRHSSMKAASFRHSSRPRPWRADDRRDRHEARAEQRVRPRREDLEFVRCPGAVLPTSSKRSAGPRSGRSSSLHQAHLVRPAVERIERGRAIPPNSR